MSTKVKEKGLKIYTSRRWESIKTCFLVITWIVLGSHLELIGPTMKILAEQTKVHFDGISIILILRGAGYMFANIIGGITQHVVKKHPEGLLSFAFLIAAITVFVTPAIHSLFILSSIFFFQGISQGITDLGGTSLMLSMWGDNVAAPLNIVHLGYGFGAVFANLFVQPFLVEDNKIDTFSYNSTSLIQKEKSNILTPYAITSIICLIIAVGHLIFSILEHRLQHKTLQANQTNYTSVSTSVSNEDKQVEVEFISQYSPKSCGNGYFTYGLLMSTCWILYMFFVSGNDQTFSKFFWAYLKSSSLSISTKDATWGMIMYWFSYSMGRLICAIITVFIPVHLALSGLWLCGFILAIIWFIYVWIIELSTTNVFVLGALTGLIFSPTFPLSFGFINQRLNVNPLLVGFLLCGASLGAMSFQKAAGYILDNHPNHFPTLLITCVVLSIIFFAIALIISSIHQRKLKSTKSSIIMKDNKTGSNINEEEQQMETYLTKSEN